MAALLDVTGLTVDFTDARGRARAVDGLSLRVARGESLGIVGESGCGKTATALAIMRLLPDTARTSGVIRFSGQDISQVPEEVMTGLRGRHMAMVFQEPMSALNPVRTIGDQIAEGPRLHLGLSRRAAGTRAADLLARVGLPAPRFSPDLYPHELSGGQRQRVVIAIALSCEPELLIADEPTTALDVTTQSRILDLIVGVTDEREMGLIMISHDLGVIAEMTDRMIVLYAGQVAERGGTGEVFSAMAHPYTEGLFAALPAAVGGEGESAGGRLRTIAGQVSPPARDLRSGCPFAPRCRLATPRCRSSAPPPVSVSPGHEAMCFHPLVAQ